MFNLKQLHAEAIFTTVSSGMFSLHLSGKHTERLLSADSIQYEVGGREMHMHESSGFPPTIERRRETHGERFLMTPAV